MVVEKIKKTAQALTLGGSLVLGAGTVAAENTSKVPTKTIIVKDSSTNPSSVAEFKANAGKLFVDKSQASTTSPGNDTKPTSVADSKDKVIALRPNDIVADEKDTANVDIRPVQENLEASITSIELKRSKLAKKRSKR